MTRIDEERLRVADAIVDGLTGEHDGFVCRFCGGDEDGVYRAWLAEHIARYKHLRALAYAPDGMDWGAWRRQIAEDDREPLYPTKDGDK
jgi:hypothetical protein